jgi:2-polyprenyl-3-methyl-5-hydroxy-6-metoxy-1,4-benzoquinol methylase
MKCLSCKSRKILSIYNFGKIPLVNSFSENFKISNKKYRLDLVVCKNCKTCQLNKAPHGDIIFKNYKFFSSASVDTVKHFKSIVSIVKKNFPNCKNILEIGCNDGTLLSLLDNKNFENIVGIDPAVNMKNREIHLKLNTIFKHFNHKVMNNLKIRSNNNGYDLIIGLNVFAHFPTVQSSFLNVSKLLTKNGSFFFEVAYATKTVFSGLHDTVYHEHIFNHSLISLKNMLSSANLKIIHASLIDTQGGSLRIICQKKEATPPVELKISNQYKNILKKEVNLGLNTMPYYKSLASKISESTRKINKLIQKFIPNKSSPVILIGAPGRGVVIANTTNIKNYTNLIPLDDTKEKHGAFFPGTKCKVLTWKDLKRKEKPNVAILLCWNYRETMLKKIKSTGFKGKILSFFPKLNIIKI